MYMWTYAAVIIVISLQKNLDNNLSVLLFFIPSLLYLYVDVAKVVLDKCIDHEKSDTITYDYEFLDDVVNETSVGKNRKTDTDDQNDDKADDQTE